MLQRFSNCSRRSLLHSGIAGLLMPAPRSVPGAIGQSTVEARSIPQWQARNLAHRACPEARPGEVQCELLIMNKS